MDQRKLRLLREAITTAKQVAAVHGGLPRVFCPHVLGRKDGTWRVLAWQFGGHSVSGTLPDWRCFLLSELTDLHLQDGEWHRGVIAGDRDQTCVSQIDSEVAAGLGPLPAGPGARCSATLRPPRPPIRS